MDANTVTLVQTVAIFGALFGFWWKLDGKIEKVRDASETAHKEIITRLGEIDKGQAIHSERFNTVDARMTCIEDKVDGVQRQLDKDK